MTKDEAIQRLRALYLVNEDEYDKEAVMTGIRAVKQPEIVRCKDCLYYECGRCGCHCMKVVLNDYCSYAVGKYKIE